MTPREAQTALAGLGLYTGRIDGDFGRDSQAALVEAFRATDVTPVSPRELLATAGAFGVPSQALRAVLAVESNGRGFDPATRLPVILYEPHVFHRLTGGIHDLDAPSLSYPKWGERPYPKSQAERWLQLQHAFAIDPDAALQSASWGLFQVMGFNCTDCGFASPWAFALAMSHGEGAQLDAAMSLMRHKGMLAPLKACDWPTVARLWNGSGQVDAYAAKLTAAYKRGAVA